MRLIDADRFKEYLMKGTEEELKEAFARGVLTKESEKRTEGVLRGFLMDIDEQPTVKPINLDKLKQSLMDYFEIGDSDFYQLTKIKEAFTTGTMKLDDFKEFDDETIDDLMEYLIKNMGL